jgi:hypothetical protein
MSSEYRRAKRRQANHAIEVIDTMTEEVIGRIGNLSETGMLMVANRHLNNDALYQLRFQLLDGIGTGPLLKWARMNYGPMRPPHPGKSGPVCVLSTSPRKACRIFVNGWKHPAANTFNSHCATRAPDARGVQSMERQHEHVQRTHTHHHAARGQSAGPRGF